MPARRVQGRGFNEPQDSRRSHGTCLLGNLAGGSLIHPPVDMRQSNRDSLALPAHCPSAELMHAHYTIYLQHTGVRQSWS